MKLSIVIPAYNEEKYIGNCLASVMKEVKKRPEKIEVIVVNNASTDRTKEIALSFEGVIVIDEPKKGLPSAREAGFLASNGDIIANIDADIFLPKNWISKVMKEFKQNKKLVAFSGPYIYYDCSLFTNIFIWLYYIFGYSIYLISHHIFHIGAMLQGGNFVLRRSALEKIGGFNTNIKFYGEDTDIARRIQKIGQVKFSFLLTMYTSGRRFHKEGIMKTALKYTINFFWITVFKKPFRDNYTHVGQNLSQEDVKKQ